MKLAFVINDLATEQSNYTTIRLSRIASARGHTVALIGLGDFIYDPEGEICAMATLVGKTKFEKDEAFLEEIQTKRERERICLADYDILMLRSDPAQEMGTRDWAPAAGLLFSQIAAKSGTIVLNDPKHLTDAVNKTYFQHFPESVRPKTLITREPEEVKRFVDAQKGGKAVIKPLQGSGGQGVFIIDKKSGRNMNQIIEAVTRDGYAIVQEYLAKAKDGDIRMITLNGRPLKVGDTYACLHRFSQTEDHRSNISAGGGVEMIEPDEDMLKVAELAGPKLIEDGMYLCGLDIVGDKMMEINVDTPGGINFLEDLSGVDFCGAILDDLERKVRLKEQYGGSLNNLQLAVL